MRGAPPAGKVWLYHKPIEEMTDAELRRERAAVMYVCQSRDLSTEDRGDAARYFNAMAYELAKRKDAPTTFTVMDGTATNRSR